MALEGVTMHAIPWLAKKKTVEMGRYSVSELMRNKNMQKKAVNFALAKVDHLLKILLHKCLIHYLQKLDHIKNIKQIEKILMGEQQIFIN